MYACKGSHKIAEKVDINKYANIGPFQLIIQNLGKSKPH
jgi:hypothetical protein